MQINLKSLFTELTQCAIEVRRHTPDQVSIVMDTGSRIVNDNFIVNFIRDRTVFA